MSDNTIHYFGILGFTFAILLVDVLIIILLGMLAEVASKIKRKHRFKKKPLAKCYCIDCVHYFKNYGRCSLSGMCRLVPENWFCKEARPYL